MSTTNTLPWPPAHFMWQVAANDEQLIIRQLEFGYDNIYLTFYLGFVWI